jgi:hypothetical protein
MKMNINNATSVQQVLNTYYANSGQLVSLVESSIFFLPNTNVLTRAEIREALKNNSSLHIDIGYV